MSLLTFPFLPCTINKKIPFLDKEERKLKLDFNLAQNPNFYTEIKSFYDSQTLDILVRNYIETMVIYSSAIKEISTKLEILNDEFQAKNKRNPIEHMKTRIKSPKSMIEKLQRKGYDFSLESIQTNLNDIAGIRVICSFIDDIYMVANILKSQDDITIVSEKDYIQHPKPNGYRSLHLVLEIPVFFSDTTELVKVEIQIRTIAMDFWASLEHKLYYKIKSEFISEEIRKELQECAGIIAATDLKMQKIHKKVHIES